MTGPTDNQDAPDLIIPPRISNQLTTPVVLPIIEVAMDLGYSIEWTKGGGLKGWKNE